MTQPATPTRTPPAQRSLPDPEPTHARKRALVIQTVTGTCHELLDKLIEAALRQPGDPPTNLATPKAYVQFIAEQLDVASNALQQDDPTTWLRAFLPTHASPKGSRP